MGKLKNIIKLNITLRFNINIKIYNLVVLFKFKIAIFHEIQIDLNTPKFSSTITYFEYESNILKIVHRKNKIKNI